MLGIKTEETKIISVTSDEVKPIETPVIEETKEEPENLETTPIPNPLPAENPLFNNNVPNFNDKEEPADPEDNDNNFWFSSDMPDALNDLPDLEVSNDTFFGDNTIPDLNFPDLKLDFGPNDTEEK